MSESLRPDIPETPAPLSPARQWLQRWQGGEAGDVGDFLAAAGPLSPNEAVAVLLVEQRERWQRGQRTLAETYLARHAELQQDPEAVLALLYGEFLLRLELGDQPALAEYRQRFPAYADWLEKQLALYELLQSHNGSDPATVRAPPPPGPGPRPGQVASAGAPSPSSPPDLPRIPGYEVLGEIGRGGMGVVLRVHDTTFQRHLAIKVLLTDPRSHPEMARRFREEAQVLGQLQHPGIPPIHALGQLADGRPYFSMKLIKGQTLAELLRQRPSPAHELSRFLAIFGQLCQAVAYAHSRGILHRDLKPSNVMVGAFGEVQVMDWGLAKLLNKERAAAALHAAETSASATVRSASADSSTQTGDVLGTPAYMAPEQARGEIDQLDERCDVFGLGAILCVLLTGKPPYLGSSSREIHPLAARGALEGAYARLDACGAEPESVALARACLAKDAAQRPHHAGVVAEAVAAYQIQVQEKLRQAEVARAQAQVKASEERKRRRLTLALALLLLLLLGGGGGVAWWADQQQAEQDKEQALRLAEARSGVEVALQEARSHGDRARTLVINPASWQTTLTAARSAVERAESLLAREAGLAEGTLAQQVRQLRAQLEADRKDWQLLAVYDQVRLEQSQWDLQGGRFKLAESYPRLKQALADYGLAIGGLEPGQAVERLRQRPQAVQPYVRAVLEECLAWVPKGEVGPRQWLAAVLAVDADPWLAQFRQALTKGAWAEVEQLAGQAEVGHYHPAVLVGLARALPDEAGASAVLLLRRTQQHYPGDFWANFTLAEALYRSVFPTAVDRPTQAEELPVVNEAVALLRVAVGLRPGNAPAHNNLGLALKAKGDGKGAIACFKKALALDPKDVLAHNSLGNALYDQGEVKGAMACFHQALTLAPNDAKTHTNLGSALYIQGHLQGAIACYQKALALDPKFAPAHYNLGNALYARGNVTEAMACYQKALALDPKHAKAQNNLGNALSKQGNVKGAIACYTKALDLDAKLVQAHGALGRALLAQGDVTGAIASYKQAIALDPKLAPAHYDLGNVLKAQGDLKGAIECYQKALALAPKHVAAHYNLGLALDATWDVSRAITCYQKALALDPKYAPAHTNLGYALYKQGDVKEAIACSKKALDLDPKLVEAHNNLGLALQAQGDVKKAIACYNKALALNPKYAPAHTNLGNALKAQGNVKKAIACYTKALSLDPKLAPAHYNLGNALKAQGDVKEAIACYQKALALDPRYAEAHCNLGLALRAQGHFAQALQALQRGHQLGAQRPSWRYPSARWLADCQRLLDLDSRLPALLQGDTHPKDAADRLQLADLCVRYKKRYLAAVQFYTDALQVALRYDAACAATLAASGQGVDAAKLDPKDKARLRQQALDWLRGALKSHTQQLADADAKGRQALQRTLQHWQKDEDLASVRDPKALALLPAAERALWQQFWADVQTLRHQASK
jgi:tetratricopeptide (TPR) repeat protein